MIFAYYRIDLEQEHQQRLYDTGPVVATRCWADSCLIEVEGNSTGRFIARSGQLAVGVTVICYKQEGEKQPFCEDRMKK
jgi:hypothetical protein